MKATEVKLLDFLKKSPQFTIPIYQRTYSWTKCECEQLWSDIFTNRERRKMFLLISLVLLFILKRVFIKFPVNHLFMLLMGSRGLQLFLLLLKL